MDTAWVFHPVHGFSMCYGPYSPMPEGWVHPESGMAVDCRVCGRPGVIPDEGQELKFLPPGTERTEDGKSFIYRPPSRLAVHAR